jgi:hypothetical protein
MNARHEHAPFAGREPFRCDPSPENQVGIDQEGTDHLLGSKSWMTSSGMDKSSAKNRPLRSPYLIGFRS